jgi:hypothetical protein
MSKAEWIFIAIIFGIIFLVYFYKVWFEYSDERYEKLIEEWKKENMK